METIEPRLTQSLTFVAVADAGSFTRAAERLGCSKAHASKQVATLEKALGVQLLLRTTRRLALTEAGRLYLEHCRPVRDQLLDAERAVSATRQEVAGRLRITAPISFGDAFLGDILVAFQTRHPEVIIALDLSIQRRDLIAEGYDFAFRTARALEDHLVAKALGVVRDIPVASPVLLSLYPPVHGVTDLAALPCITNTHFNDDAEWVLLRDGQAETVRVAGRLSVNHFGLIRQAVLQGAGMARLPCYLVRPHLDAGTLVRLVPGHAFAPTPVYLVQPQRRHWPAAHRAFRDFVLAWFADPRHSGALT